MKKQLLLTGVLAGGLLLMPMGVLAATTADSTATITYTQPDGALALTAVSEFEFGSFVRDPAIGANPTANSSGISVRDVRGLESDDATAGYYVTALLSGPFVTSDNNSTLQLGGINLNVGNGTDLGSDSNAVFVGTGSQNITTTNTIAVGNSEASALNSTLTTGSTNLAMSVLGTTGALNNFWSILTQEYVGEVTYNLVSGPTG